MRFDASRFDRLIPPISNLCTPQDPLLDSRHEENFDRQAEVFTTQSDIPGLVVEASTFEELVDLVRSLAPQVIAANVPTASTPHKVEIVARRELAVVIHN